MDTCITETDIIDEKGHTGWAPNAWSPKSSRPKRPQQKLWHRGSPKLLYRHKALHKYMKTRIILELTMNVAMLPKQKMQQMQKHNAQLWNDRANPRPKTFLLMSIFHIFFTFPNCRSCNVPTAHSFLAAHFKSTSFTGNGGIPVLSCLGLGNCKTGRSKFARAWGSTKERGWYKAQKRLSSKWRASLELWTWRKMSERKNWRFYQLNGQTGVIASFAIDWTFYQPWLSPEHIILQQIWPRR